MSYGRKIVCLGNGTGQAVLLNGLKGHPYQLMAIVGVTDNGGHSGLIRRAMDIPSPGDLRHCLAGLADPQEPLARLLGYRFSEGALSGISLGNLMLAALIRQEGGLSAAAERLRQMLGIEAQVLPASDESTQVCAELTDGRHITGEWEIIERKPRTPIQRIYLERPIRAFPGCLRAIEEADAIVFSPGSLLTGLVSLLLTEGIREALAVSRARKIYVCNLMTQPGQTDGFALSHHVRTLSAYLPAPPDYVLANDGPIPAPLQTLYESSGAHPVEIDPEADLGGRVLRADLADRSTQALEERVRPAGEGLKAGLHLITHHPARLGQALVRIIEGQA
ncbi:MAG: YvcK family protein [Candidatus Tectomicrobia bacterium]|uniref:Putative gluconeogenesis factor n=1 Tax=Tectimicrobiota bacterium TaxID=2528274 RepID=A0A932CL08_UNCTE|nr:YvcK family protein [Candidatus Tectomicrobia bacterium]